VIEEPVIEAPVTDGDSEDFNLPPVILSLAGGPTPVMVNDPVEFSWEVADPDFDTLSCALDADGDGTVDITFDDCSGTSTTTFFYDAPGDYTAVLVVTDPDEAEASSEFGINVHSIMARLSSKSPVVAGSLSLMDLRISNVSNVPVNNVQAVFRLPIEMSFNSGMGAQPNASGCLGTTCNDGDEASWFFSVLQPGESRTIEINPSVDEGLFNAIVESEFVINADGLLSTIVIPADASVVNEVGADVSIDAETLVAEQGAVFDVITHIGNLSTGNLVNTSLRMTLPLGVDIVSIGEQGFQDEASGDVVWNIPEFSVLQSQSRTVTVAVQPSAVTGLTLPFIATFSEPGESGFSVVDRRSVPVVAPAQDLLLDVSSISNPVQQGGDPGESRTLTLYADIDPIVPGGSLITLPFTVTSTDLQQTRQSRYIARVDNAPRSQLVASLIQTPSTISEEFEIDLDVGNITSQILENGVLSLSVPDFVSFLSLEGDNGSLNADTGEVVWSGVSADVLSSSQFTARFAVNSDAIAGVSGQFQANLNFSDSDQIDVASEVFVAVSQQRSPIRLSVEPSEDPATPGGQIRFQFALLNDGLVPINNVSLLYRVPDAFSFSENGDATPNASKASLYREP